MATFAKDKKIKSMKKFISPLVCCMLISIASFAQNAGDKILGTYRAIQAGNVSKVKFTKNGNGYKAQIIWLEHPNNPDGTPKLDKKNSDKSKRSVRADQIVLIEKVTYKDGVWSGGKVYDPTKGKSFNVEIKFKDAKTLQVTGSLLIFSQTVEWTKLD